MSRSRDKGYYGLYTFLIKHFPSYRQSRNNQHLIAVALDDTTLVARTLHHHHRVESSNKHINMQNNNGHRSNGPNLTAQSTLMGLPNELLIKVISFAVTSDEAIYISYETFDQDLTQLKRRLFAPFAGTPTLLAIAQAELSPAECLHRTQLRRLYVPEWQRAADHSLHASTDSDGSGPEDPGSENHYGRALWFGPDRSSESIEKSANCVRHLELIVPLEVIGNTTTPTGNTAQSATNTMTYLFRQLGKAFPELRSLLVRVTTYSIGQRIAMYQRPNAAGEMRYAHQRPDLVALEFRLRIAKIIEAIDSMRSPELKSKSMIFCQRRGREWREWRDGPLNEPTFEVTRLQSDRDNVDGFVWRMMDFPSCRVKL